MVTKRLWRTRTPFAFQKRDFSNQSILPLCMVEWFRSLDFCKLCFYLSQFAFEIYYSNEIILPNTYGKKCLLTTSTKFQQRVVFKI